MLRAEWSRTRVSQHSGYGLIVICLLYLLGAASGASKASTAHRQARVRGHVLLSQSTWTCRSYCRTILRQEVAVRGHHTWLPGQHSGRSQSSLAGCNASHSTQRLCHQNSPARPGRPGNDYCRGQEVRCMDRAGNVRRCILPAGNPLRMSTSPRSISLTLYSTTFLAYGRRRAKFCPD